MDRTELNKGKTGVEVKGIKAINPINGKEVPIFLGDFVLGDYGTGAVMAVPAHDQRDFEYAKEHNLEIVEVIQGGNINEKAFEKHDYLGKGCKLINSEEFTGLTVEEAKESITDMLVEKGIARKVNNYKMRDWVFGRQRFWGEPIPMIYCEDCGWVPVPEEDLPVLLQDVTEYEPTDTGESPLAKIEEFVNCKCPKCGKDAKRETDTMPQWAGSSWYFLRFMDSKNTQEFASMDAMKYWNKVDWYNGGMEHTARHLLYARFWVQFLYNIGLVPNKEMIWTRVSHGMVLGSDNQKNAPWSTDSLRGCSRFIEKVERLLDKVNENSGYTKEFETLQHQSVKKVTHDLSNMGYNTAVSQLMILTNKYSDADSITKDDLRLLLILLNPIAPHITEELNEKLGFGPIYEAKWPEYDESKVVEEEKEIGVQVNGKLRASIKVNINDDEETLKEKAMNEENVKKYTDGHEIVKVIAIKGKIVNIVVK